MTRLKEIVLNGRFDLRGGGSYVFVENFPARYIADLTKRPKLRRKLKVVCACGNGTAGAVAPQGLGAGGRGGIPLPCEARPTLPQNKPHNQHKKKLHFQPREGPCVEAGCGG